MPDCWSIVESAFNTATAKAYEGLFTQGSGYLHVRGSLEEHLTNAPQNLAYIRMPTNVTAKKFAAAKAKWGTYVPGIFGPHPTLNQEMVNLPFFLELVPVIDGDRLDMEKSRITDYRRELLLRTATLRRTLRWHTRAGPIVEVTFERFVSATRQQLCVQRMTLSSTQAVRVTIRAGIDADIRTNGHDHLKEIELSPAGKKGLACRVRTDGGDEVRTQAELIAPAQEWKYELNAPGSRPSAARAAALSAESAIPANGTLVVEKRTAVTTSRDPAATVARGGIG